MRNTRSLPSLTAAITVLLGVLMLTSVPASAQPCSEPCYFCEEATIDTNDTTCDGEDVVVDGCNVTIDGAHAFNSLEVKNGGTVKHTDNVDTQVHTLDLTIATYVLIDETSSIDVSGLGFDGAAYRQDDPNEPNHPAYGEGAGTSSGESGGGGSYGGVGGNGFQGWAPSFGGRAYGWLVEPTELGSGGGADWMHPTRGGAGGGAIRLEVGGTLTIEGEGAIRADGQDGQETDGAGGSGGSIWLIAGALVGDGYIWANGGNGIHNSGGGAGGRIAIECDDTSDFALDNEHVKVYGGLPSLTWMYPGADGKAGTIHPCALETDLTGDLDNDHDVDLADLARLLANYGNSCP